MSFSYPTVSLGSMEYNVYSDVSDAAAYLDATITEAGTGWRAADTDTQARALVSSTRWLDAAQWLGAQTDTTNALQWPRTGVTDVDPNTLPTPLSLACIELAAMLIVDPDLRANLANPITKEQKAGSVLQTVFRPHDVQVLTFFPANVMSLVSQWLQGPPVVGALPNDVHERSEINRRRDNDFIHGI
jgi:hypothetical protein